MWHVDYVPADFASVVIGLRHDLTCAESEKMIAKGRKILTQLRRRRVRLPNPDVMASWRRSLKSFKKYCKRG